jgi:hypothetical protein
MVSFTQVSDIRHSLVRQSPTDNMRDLISRPDTMQKIIPLLENSNQYICASAACAVGCLADRSEIFHEFIALLG